MQFLKKKKEPKWDILVAHLHSPKSQRALSQGTLHGGVETSQCYRDSPTAPAMSKHCTSVEWGEITTATGSRRREKWGRKSGRERGTAVYYKVTQYSN